MQNWDRFIDSEIGLTVERTSKSIIIHSETIRGRDPWRLFFLAFRECQKAADYIQGHFGMVLGHGELMRKPHFAIKDPIAKMLGEFYEFSDDVGKLDESEGFGELDLYDPNFVKDYLLAFTLIPRMARSIDEFKSALDLLAQNIREHLALIQDYRKESIERRLQSEKTYQVFLEAIAELRSMIGSLDRKLTLKGKKRFPWEI